MLKMRALLLLIPISAIVIIIYTFSFHGNPKKIANNLLQKADIHINGDRPWDMIVHNEDLYKRVLTQGSLGLGESYMDGWWDCRELDQFFFKLLRTDLSSEIYSDWSSMLHLLKAKLFNLQSKSRAFEVGKRHYDLGNDLFEAMLDKRMVYSCAYWKNASTLDEAQENKLDLICKKLQLAPGMKVLDIGCGWGGLARYMAEKYGVNVVGITISQEQADHARTSCEHLNITFRIQDYRDLNEQFDRIVSVGMFEHVGAKNYKTFMQTVHRCLKDDGLFLLHTIGSNVITRVGDPWITTYIFPNGQLPSPSQIAQTSENLFVMEDWHNFGADYDKTLMAWFKNFDSHWKTLQSKYDERFYRMWKYYLLSCAGLFRARQAQLWQIVFSKKGLLGGYNSLR